MVAASVVFTYLRLNSDWQNKVQTLGANVNTLEAQAVEAESLLKSSV